MPIAHVSGLEINYDFSGPAGAPVILFSNSLGSNFSMWDPQVPGLSSRFRLLRCDTRGEGKTSVTSGPYTIEQLGRDVIALMDHLGIDRAHFCGLSMGGMIGMWLALNAEQRLHKVALCNTAAKIGTPETWNPRIETVTRNGMAAVSAAITERWFSPAFRARTPDTVSAVRRMIESMPPAGYAACCAAVRDCDLRAELSRIRVPTLVISGTHDPATPPADGRFIVERILGAHFVEFNASHLSNIEAAAQFTSELIRFLAA